MRLPLNVWRLHVQNLPKYLMDEPEEDSFSLPGADALNVFSDLIGASETDEHAAQETGAVYNLCGLFEEDLTGALSLTREIDFGALTGDRAVLTFEHIAGKGEILLGGRIIARFDSESVNEEALLQAFEETGMPCRLCVDVTDALELGRNETLELRFDDVRPAGVCGAVFLSTSFRAHLSRASIQADAHRASMTVRVCVSAQRAGHYILRAQAVPCGVGAALPPIREIELALAQGEEKGVVLSMEVSAGRFVPGRAYDAPAIRIQLFDQENRNKGSKLPCDEALLMCGYGADAPKAFLPLDDQDCMGDVKALCDMLCALHVPAVSLCAPAPDGLYRAFCRVGIAAVQYVSEALRPAFTRYPCLTLSDFPLDQQKPSPEAAAWQMAGSVAFPRAADGLLTPQEMLFEASGRQLDGSDEGVRASLAWLRAVQIRLRAEAARQGRYQGALCSAEEANSSDVLDAIKTAFSPLHLSALPLCGAWWTDTRFSASLEAFIPQKYMQQDPVYAHAVLEDEDGNVLAWFEAPCQKSGYVGVIEAQLPDHPCVLTLSCRLLRGENVLEESSLPVYVGERGPLEAAF